MFRALDFHFGFDFNLVVQWGTDLSFSRKRRMHLAGSEASVVNDGVISLLCP